MKLENTRSLKEFVLVLIGLETGLIKGNPPNPNNVYEDFITLWENMYVSNTYQEEIWFTIPYSLTYIESDIDPLMDLYHATKIVERINTNNKMCGGVCATAVAMNVKFIYEYIGVLINEVDEYFSVVVRMYHALRIDEHEDTPLFEVYKESELDDAVSRLRTSFNLSSKRLSELQHKEE